MIASPPVRFHPAVRHAEETDVERIRELIVDLATYEHAADQVKLTSEQLRQALFGPEPTAFALVAEAGPVVVGFALYFVSFSTWEGVPGIYLEDLFVTPDQRGKGLGRGLLQSLAALAVDRGYARVEWSVLNWNQPSIDFYAALGARPQDDWTVFRLTGAGLTAAARVRGPAQAR